MIKTIPKKKKSKKAKWLSEEALQIAEKRSKRQRRKGKIHPSKCRVPKNSTEKALVPHSNTLAWKIPWTEESSRLQSMGP